VYGKDIPTPPAFETYRIYIAARQDATLDVSFDRDRYLLGEQVNVEARIYSGGEHQYDIDMIGGQPILDAHVQAEVIGPSGETVGTYPFENAGEVQKLAFTPTSGVGSYRFRITALRINSTNPPVADFAVVSEHSIYVSSSAYPGGSAQQRIIEARDLLSSINSNDQQVKNSVKIALESINHCLLPSFWIDGNHLGSTGGDVFKDLKKAANEITKLLRKPSVQAIAVAALNDLYGASSVMASIAISEATCNSPTCQTMIEAAKKQMEQAQKQADKKNYDTAIEHHRVAWEDVQKATGAVLPKLGEQESNALEKPSEFGLGQNFPNPFNPTTVITYQLPRESQVVLEVFNVLGERVATLVDGVREAGYHEVVWDASRLPSGVYVCRIQAGEFVAHRKLLFLK
jgi:hypothetical protein